MQGLLNSSERKDLIQWLCTAPLASDVEWRRSLLVGCPEVLTSTVTLTGPAHVVFSRMIDIVDGPAWAYLPKEGTWTILTLIQNALVTLAGGTTGAELQRLQEALQERIAPQKARRVSGAKIVPLPSTATRPHAHSAVPPRSTGSASRSTSASRTRKGHDNGSGDPLISFLRQARRLHKRLATMDQRVQPGQDNWQEKCNAVDVDLKHATALIADLRVALSTGRGTSLAMLQTPIRLSLLTTLDELGGPIARVQPLVTAICAATPNQTEPTRIMLREKLPDLVRLWSSLIDNLARLQAELPVAR